MCPGIRLDLRGQGRRRFGRRHAHDADKRAPDFRLAEIDAPEKRQPFGERSKQSLSDLVYGKRVKVNQQDRNRYGRVVGRVYTESLDVNAEQIKRGMLDLPEIQPR
jgi:endonuclease YncB( thermonuclease family)